MLAVERTVSQMFSANMADNILRFLRQWSAVMSVSMRTIVRCGTVGSKQFLRQVLHLAPQRYRLIAQTRPQVYKAAVFTVSRAGACVGGHHDGHDRLLRARERQKDSCFHSSYKPDTFSFCSILCPVYLLYY